MTELVNLSWRAYPAGLLLVVGAIQVSWSVYRAVVRSRRLRDPSRALVIMLGFRAAIIGFALAAFGAAWWWQIGWLFGLALVIAGEELLESTVVISALKHAGEPVPPYPGLPAHRHTGSPAHGGFAARDRCFAIGRIGDGVAAVAALAAQQHAQ
jgi:hypothetical protein